MGSAAFGLNDHGEAVGVSYVNMNGNIANARPVRWNVVGRVDKLWEGDGIIYCWWDEIQAKFICNQTAQYGGGIPLDINSNGWVAGRSQTNTYDGTPLPMLGVPEGMAFVWDPTTGRRQDLGTLGGVNSTAEAINDAGQVAGTTQLANGEARAFVWDAVSGMRDLGTLAGDYSYASAINASGQVVGYSSDGKGSERAVLWDSHTGITDLGTLGGLFDYSRALAVNDAGIVVGTSRSDTYGGAFLWDPVTGITSLNTDPVVPFGDAYSINNLGTVVGMGGGPGTGTIAVLWDALHGPRDLQSLIAAGNWDLESALAVNDLGHIVGYGLRDGVLRAYLAVPVPEPSAAVLMALGVSFTGLLFSCRTPTATTR